MPPIRVYISVTRPITKIEKLNDQPVISVNGIAVIKSLTPSARTLIIRKTEETNLWNPTPHLFPIN